jgi:hypothetical protein
MDIRLGMGIFANGIWCYMGDKIFKLGTPKRAFSPSIFFIGVRISNKYALSSEMTGVDKCSLHLRIGNFMVYKYLGGMCYSDFDTARANGTITEEQMA